MDTLVLADHHGITHINSVRTLDAVKKTDPVQWMIGVDIDWVKERHDDVSTEFSKLEIILDGLTYP